jgi:asparagine synthetase B (glutamine-hydrolysing)
VEVSNGIIPTNATYYRESDGHIVPHSEFLNQTEKLDLKAICIFAAAGFFLDQDSYYIGIKALPPASKYELNEDKISNIQSYFSWHYSPADLSLESATEQFQVLLEAIVKKQCVGKKMILPLSGGLDSRSLAAAARHHKDIYTYSYEFENGEKETWYSEQIAKAEHFPFKKYIIKAGYLWPVIERLGQTNICTSEFTHPRQMAVIDALKNAGDTFLLGHWGDVLFDGMGVEGTISFDEQVEVLYKKVLKKGGKELGKALWEHWGLEGNFDDYLKNRISDLHKNIKIEDANARIRAFKSMYWAPRWTSTNFSIFSKDHELALPYYDDRMCRFICTIPEHLLADRQIQIEYMKKFAPELARIERQGFGLDLYNFQHFDKWHNIPNRVMQRVKRVSWTGKKVQRNWEIQFVGQENEQHLEEYLYQNSPFNELIDPSIVRKFHQHFKEDGIYYSHPLSLLLTLSVFCKLTGKASI